MSALFKTLLPSPEAFRSALGLACADLRDRAHRALGPQPRTHAEVKTFERASVGGWRGGGWAEGAQQSRVRWVTPATGPHPCQSLHRGCLWRAGPAVSTEGCLSSLSPAPWPCQVALTAVGGPPGALGPWACAPSLRTSPVSGALSLGGAGEGLISTCLNLQILACCPFLLGKKKVPGKRVLKLALRLDAVQAVVWGRG